MNPRRPAVHSESAKPVQVFTMRVNEVFIAVCVIFSSFSLSLRILDTATPSISETRSMFLRLLESMPPTIAESRSLAPHLARPRPRFFALLSLRGGSTGRNNHSQVSGCVLESLNTTVQSVAPTLNLSSGPPPVVKQPTLQKNRTIEVMQEGLARFVYEKGVVFYNNVQVVNRDLSVLMLRYLCELKQSESDAAALAAAAKSAAVRQLNESATALSPDTNHTAASCVDAGPPPPDIADPDAAPRTAAPADPAAAAADADAAASRVVPPPASDGGPPSGACSAPTAGKNRTAGGLHVLDALSATGLRALRYTLEVSPRSRSPPRPPPRAAGTDVRRGRGAGP
jgi:hypothetical protein